MKIRQATFENLWVKTLPEADTPTTVGALWKELAPSADALTAVSS
jgi:hypothetical protein